MDSFNNCPRCHQQVNVTAYFCTDCGHVLKKRPPTTTFLDLVILIIKTVLLPPLGIIWGINYLRQTEQKSKIIGLIVIIITVIETIWVTKVSLDLFTTANQMVSQQLSSFGL